MMKLQNCVESKHEWCRSRRLQLNPAKTERIWFGSKASLKKTDHLDLNLYIGADVIKPVGVVRDLGVFLDVELNMDQHVKTVVRSCFFHLRRLKSVGRILGREVTLGLVSAFMTTRLDYCNSVLAGPSGVNRSTSTSPERRRQTCRWNRDTGSHHSRSQKLALASDYATHTV